MSTKRFAQAFVQSIVLLVLSMSVANAQLASSFAKFQYGVDDSFKRFSYKNQVLNVVGPQANTSVNTPVIQLNNIRQHLDQMRLTGSPATEDALRVSVNGQMLSPMKDLASASDLIKQTGGGASTDKPDALARWGVFVNGDIETGRQSTVDTQTGFKTTTKGVTLGADYRFTANNVLGAAVSFLKADTDLNDGAGNQNAKGYSFSLYGSYRPTENVYIDGIMNFGHNTYDSQRTQTIGGSASSSTSGDQFGFSLSGGYQFYRGPLSLTPYGRVEYVNAKVNGFSENGDPTEAWTVSGQRITATTLTLGGQASYALSTSWGVLIPNGRLEFQHVAQSSAHDVSAQIPIFPTTQISVPIVGQDINFGMFAIGVSAIFSRGVSAFFNYEQLFSKNNFSDQHYTLGVRVDF